MSATHEQRIASLRLANHVRFARAELKRRIKSGETSVSTLLAEPLPDWLEGMSCGELMEAMPFVGPAKTYRYIADVGNLSYTRSLGHITTRQKATLISILAAKEQELERQRPYKKREKSEI